MAGPEVLSSLSVVQLKQKLREAGLAVSGNKNELVDRLRGHMASAQKPSADAIETKPAETPSEESEKRPPSAAAAETSKPSEEVMKASDEAQQPRDPPASASEAAAVPKELPEEDAEEVAAKADAYSSAKDTMDVSQDGGDEGGEEPRAAETTTTRKTADEDDDVDMDNDKADEAKENDDAKVNSREEDQSVDKDQEAKDDKENKKDLDDEKKGSGQKLDMSLDELVAADRPAKSKGKGGKGGGKSSSKGWRPRDEGGRDGGGKWGSGWSGNQSSWKGGDWHQDRGGYKGDRGGGKGWGGDWGGRSAAEDYERGPRSYEPRSFGRWDAGYGRPADKDSARSFDYRGEGRDDRRYVDRNRDYDAGPPPPRSYSDNRSSEARTIVVSGLGGLNVDKRDLIDAFGAAGPVDDAIIKGSKAIITFRSPRAAADAVKRFHGGQLNDRNIEVYLEGSGPGRNGGGGRGGRSRTPPRRAASGRSRSKGLADGGLPPRGGGNADRRRPRSLSPCGRVSPGRRQRR